MKKKDGVKAKKVKPITTKDQEMIDLVMETEGEVIVPPDVTAHFLAQAMKQLKNVHADEVVE